MSSAKESSENSEIKQDVVGNRSHLCFIRRNIWINKQSFF